LFSRLLNLLAFPPFIDEYLHIAWAQDVYRGHFLTGAENGRLIALWWMALFQLSGDGVLWIVRTVTILFSMVGLATVYSLGRKFAATIGGILAASLYILAPFIFFHDRLALSDTYVSVLGILAVWFSVRFTSRQRPLEAILAGLLVTSAVVAKANGIMLALTPGIAILLLMPLPKWKKIAQGLLLAYGAFFITFGPFYVLLKWRGWAYFGVATTVVGTDSGNGLIQRLIINLREAWTTDAIYLSSTLLVLTVLVTVYLIIRKPRAGLFLALTTLLPLAAVCAFASKLSGRYILFHVPMLILCLAVGLGKIAANLQQRNGLVQKAALPLVTGIILVWGILFALPFQATAKSDPASLVLSPADRNEYITADSSGFTFKDVGAYLLNESTKSSRPIHAVGLIANCGGLGLEIPIDSAVTLECPYITYSGSEQANLAKLVNQRAADTSNFDLWIVNENLPYATLEGVTVPYEQMASFDRPGGRTTIRLYHVQPTN
jgi:hypothetical protein